MGKTALDAPRADSPYWFNPEELTLVRDKSHYLYDPTVDDPVDERLVRSLMRRGNKVPVIVRKEGDAVLVVDGRGRVKAALEANRRLVDEGCMPIRLKCMAEKGTQAEAVGTMILTNELRRVTSPFEKADKALRMQQNGATLPEIADSFGVTEQAVRDWLKMEEMPEPVRKAVEAGDLSAKAATKLSGLPVEKQTETIKKLKGNGGRVTAKRVADAVAGGEGSKDKRLRSRKEIEDRLKGSESDDFKNALRWVLRIEE